LIGVLLLHRTLPAEAVRAGMGEPIECARFDPDLVAVMARGRLGLSVGPVPPGVDATVKAGLLELVDDGRAAGWSARRAALILGLDLDRPGSFQPRLDGKGRRRPDGIDKIVIGHKRGMMVYDVRAHLIDI
jgi:hypothetical protein